MSNDITRKTKPAMITITDAMTIVNAYHDQKYAWVEGTKGLVLTIDMRSGAEFAICESCGLSFHVNKIYKVRIEEENGKLWIYGREIIDVPIKGLWEEAQKLNAKRVEEAEKNYAKMMKEAE